MKKPKNFEEGIAALEGILAQLSDETTPLDKSVALYAQAAELVQYCSQTLSAAKLQVEEIDQKLMQEAGSDVLS